MQNTYIEGPSPLYTSYASPDQTKQHQHHVILEGDKGQLINKVSKVKES